ncbi:peptidylprolyl isomerase [Urechidicola vernalis]|uniref:Peptidylprolyl isomerase n=1 Tax=Urechidicola vernalis TaxID=3075600 RepID=A0ABU2Y1J0_9FLAO|nr:peptidylprolyl isomerase [Urechidicola sp. P050]MDT0552078.1 peptidylprolyl isomerase [Urechidicola sp. P050]
MKHIKMIRRGLILALVLLTITISAQERVKVDGVIVVVGKNIVLESDVENFRKQVEMQSEGKITLSDCEMLEEIMTQKLLSHHAVIDSIVVSEARIEEKVERDIFSFSQSLRTDDIQKVVDYYGFSDEADLRNELTRVAREGMLIQGERDAITAEIDVTPDEVRTYFKSLEEGGNLPEFGSEIELSQIVIYAEPTEEEEQEVIDKLNEIREDVLNGSSFHMKAILNSDDPSVSGQGPGAGGFYSINRESQFVKEFKEVAFSLEEGEISEPFKSDFGYHIIQVEKIKGQQIDMRHILIQPDIDEAKLQEAKETLEKVKKDILEGTTTFEEAVKNYCQEDETRFNKGQIVNTSTGDTFFELTRMDPTLYSRVASLNASEITEPYYDETREGEKMFKLLLLKSKSESHTANYVDDYVKIQSLALQKKQEEAVEDWAEDKIKDTYIKITEEHKNCEFDRNWNKD